MFRIDIFTTDYNNKEKTKYVEELYPLIKDAYPVPYTTPSLNTPDAYLITIIETPKKGKERMVGLLCLSLNKNRSTKEITPWNDSGCCWCVMNVGINEKYKGLGLSKLLIEEMFKFAVDNEISGVYQSSYSKEGFLYTLPFFEKMSLKYPDVNFVDEKRTHFYFSEKEILEMDLPKNTKANKLKI